MKERYAKSVGKAAQAEKKRSTNVQKIELLTCKKGRKAQKCKFITSHVTGPGRDLFYISFKQKWEREETTAISSLRQVMRVIALELSSMGGRSFVSAGTLPARPSS